MFCSKCGNQIPDGEKVCPVCGAPVEETPLVNAAARSPKTKLIALGAAALAVILIAIIVISSIVTGSSAAGVAKKFTKASLSGNLRKADGYNLISTGQRFEDSAKDNDMDLEEYLDEYYKCDSMKEFWSDRQEDVKDSLEEEYGKHVKVKIEKIKKVDKYTNSELKDFRENNESRFDEYDLDVDKVKAVSEVTLKVKIKGSEDDDKEDVTWTMVKYKGKWRVWSAY